MSDASKTIDNVFGGVVLLAAGFAALIVQLAPLGLRPADAGSPDLFYCVLAFFALRRPDVAGPLTVFALALVQDALLGGPLGAGALGLMLTYEALKLRARQARRHGLARSVWRDWLAAGLGAGATLLIPWLLMLLSFADPPPLIDLAERWLLTVASFPLVAALLRYVGLQRGRDSQTDAPRGDPR